MKSEIPFNNTFIKRFQDATINTAIATIDSAKEYLVTARDTAVNKVEEDQPDSEN